MRLPSATWLINQNLASAYNIQTLTSDSLELCGATDYSNSVLCSVLGKAIKASSYAFNEIVTNNTLPEDNLGTNITRIPPIRLAVIVVALFIVVLMLVWALVSLQRRHRDKAAVMEQLAENRRRENELAALEKATESKNRFFSNISHDMRTPLNAIIGFSGLAQVKAASPEVKDYLKKIQSSGQLLLELINDTLMISKSNSGKLELRPEPVTIEEIFDSVVIPIRDAAALKKIDFTADCSGAVPRTVLADKLNVQKILLNLLTNAVKYTPEGAASCSPSATRISGAACRIPS
jgi:signal transduction histidine kinase